MKRRPLTRLACVRIFDRAQGICLLCGLKIHAERGEKWDAHHIVALWLGGPDDESNMAPAHKSCHRRLSAADNPERANFLGIDKPAMQPLPCGRKSGFKKTMRHGVVERMSQSEKHRETMARRNGGFE